MLMSNLKLRFNHWRPNHIWQVSGFDLSISQIHIWNGSNLNLEQIDQATYFPDILEPSKPSLLSFSAYICFSSTTGELPLMLQEIIIFSNGYGSQNQIWTTAPWRKTRDEGEEEVEDRRLWWWRYNSELHRSPEKVRVRCMWWLGRAK